jgi:hypothetical protein
LLKCGKDSGVNSIPHHICTEYFATKNLVWHHILCKLFVKYC